MRLFLMLIICACSLFMGGCQNILPDTPYADEDLMKVIDCISTNDMDGMYSMFDKEIDQSKEEFGKGFADIVDEYEGTYQSHSKTGYYVRVISNNDGKKKIVDIEYLVKTDVSTYFFSMIYADYDGDKKLYSCNVQENLSYAVNGRLSQFRVIDLILLLYSLLCFAIIIFAFIKCIKSKIRRKVLWIIGILFQTGIVVSIFPNHFKINFQVVQLLSRSQQIVYAHGGKVTALFVPLIAIIFLVTRKNLEQKQLKRLEMLENQSDNTDIYQADDIVEAEEIISEDNEQVSRGNNETDKI